MPRTITMNMLLLASSLLGCSAGPEPPSDPAPLPQAVQLAATQPVVGTLALPSEEAPPPRIGEMSLSSLALGALIFAEVAVLGPQAERIEYGAGNLPDRSAEIRTRGFQARVLWASSRHFKVPNGVIDASRVESKRYFDSTGRAVGEMQTPALDDSPGLAAPALGERLLVALVPAPSGYRLVGSWLPARHSAALARGATGLEELRARFNTDSAAAGRHELRVRAAIDSNTFEGAVP